LSQDLEVVVKNLNYSIKVIVSKHECGNPHQSLNHFDFPHYIFNQTPKIWRARIPEEFSDINAIEKSSDKIVVSFSTISSAVQIDAYMGAKNIIICG
jgi:hypothetical protein